MITVLLIEIVGRRKTIAIEYFVFCIFVLLLNICVGRLVFESKIIVKYIFNEKKYLKRRFDIFYIRGTLLYLRCFSVNVCLHARVLSDCNASYWPGFLQRNGSNRRNNNAIHSSNPSQSVTSSHTQHIRISGLVGLFGRLVFTDRNKGTNAPCNFFNILSLLLFFLFITLIKKSLLGWRGRNHAVNEFLMNFLILNFL